MSFRAECCRRSLFWIGGRRCCFVYVALWGWARGWNALWTIIKIKFIAFEFYGLRCVRCNCHCARRSHLYFRNLIMFEHDARDPHQRSRDNRVFNLFIFCHYAFLRKSLSPQTIQIHVSQPRLSSMSDRLQLDMLAFQMEFYFGVPKIENKMPNLLWRELMRNRWEHWILNQFKSTSKAYSVHIILFKSINEPGAGWTGAM